MSHLVLAVFVIAAHAEGSASAPTPRRARDLVKAGRYLDACPLLERMHRDGPSLDNLLGVATCWERAGTRVKAYQAFSEAAAQAEAAHDDSRANFARARLDAIAARLSFVVLSSVSPERALRARIGDLELEVGTEPRRVPVEEPQVTVSAFAPGFETWQARVLLSPGARVEVMVPPLLPRATPAMAEVPEPPPPPPPPPVALAGRSSTSIVAPVVLLSASAVMFIAGLGGLSWSWSTFGHLQAQQPGSPEASAPTVTREQLERVRVVYPASWAAVCLGTAGLAATGLWLLFAPSSELVVTPSSGGVSVSGRF